MAKGSKSRGSSTDMTGDRIQNDLKAEPNVVNGCSDDRGTGGILRGGSVSYPNAKKLSGPASPGNNGTP